MSELGPYDIFLSHSTADAEVARALAKRLRDSQLSVFMAQDSIGVGESFRRTVDQAVRSATVTVVIIGPSASVPQFVAPELSTAASAAMTGQSLLVPLIVGDVTADQVPVALRQFRAIRVGSPEALDEAADAIRKAAIGSERAEEARPAPPLSPPLPDSYVATEATRAIVAAISASILARSGCVQVVGPAGAGKTTAVVAACHETAAWLSLLGWISATTEQEVTHALAQLGSKVGAPRGAVSESEHAAAVVECLAARQHGWLLVFDDADVGDAWLRRWIPRSSSAGTTIVISRSSLPLQGSVVELGSLDDESALRIFESHIGAPLDDDVRHALLKLLADIGGRTTLTVAILAARFKTVKGSSDQRIDYLRSEFGEATSWKRGPTIRDFAIERFRSVEKRSKLAWRISEVLGSVGGAHVPTQLFIKSADDPFLTSDREDVVQALDELQASGLVRLSEVVALSHPVLLDGIELSPDSVEALEFVRRAVARRHNFGRPGDRELTQLASLAQGALATSTRAESPKVTVSAALICLEVAQLLRNTEDPEHAIALLERTLVVADQILGSDHEATLSTKSNLAGAYAAGGRQQEAAVLLERTLADSQRVLGVDHPSTLTVRANLAAALQASGRPEEAAVLLEPTLADSQRVLGVDHPSTLTVRANLAAALQAFGRPEEGAVLLERTLADSQRVLGADHPSTLTVRANLAAALQAFGRPEEATELLLSTLATSESLLGPDAWLTVAVRDNLEHVRV